MKKALALFQIKCNRVELIENLNKEIPPSGADIIGLTNEALNWA